MVKNSLGLIEVVGLAAALEAADAAVKAANIEVLGYELTKGGGLVLIKICGDVGAVKAGVQAASAAASKVNKVWSTHVIPRPHQQLSCILESEETLGAKKKPKPAPVVEPQVIAVTEEPIEDMEVNTEPSVDTEVLEEVKAETALEEEQPQEPEIQTPSSDFDQDLSVGKDEENQEQQEKQPADYCNLCNDPACHRRKGDPKITCIYYGKNH